MAAGGVLRVTNGADGPSVQTEPFDIDDLCARLEVAKREREERDAARELRKQVREAVKRDGTDGRPTTARRRPKPTPLIDANVSNDWSQVQIPGLSPLRSDHLRLNLIDSIPEHSTPPFRSPSTTRSIPTSPLAPGDNGDRSHDTPTKPKRLNFFKSLTSDDSDSRLRKPWTKQRPDDVAKRRSQTSPLLHTKFRNDSTIDHQIYSHPHAEHSMSFVNEYCVSFDTGDHDRHDQIVESPQSLKPLPIDRPEWAYHHSERSLLNLPLMLKRDKKDRTRASVDEVPGPPQQQRDLSGNAQRSRPHTRSQTAPDGLICEAVRRIEQGQSGKKRRSMGAFLQTMLLPGPGVNAGGGGGSSHCVAI
ncbi:uncharacterized protein LTR77_000838 [Saxophila tyrrhenica]|uniref:Uncharacterized protein n=1 Tax=Saxophila tyrrhenica TaxID=1690608 RepID=A0AAV9PNR7_9PEZI|nr:hypothetical protein LTR77_000838 [Saxophila tyrrhenica]